MWDDLSENSFGDTDGRFQSPDGVAVLWKGAPVPQDGHTLDIGPRLVDLYRRHGVRFADRLCGSFALVLRDPAHDLAALIRDPAGTIPLYYATGPKGRLLFATQIRRLLPSLGPPALNPAKLLDFLAFFWSVNEETFFKGVQVVPQGAACVNGQIERYFNFGHCPAADDGTDPAQMTIAVLRDVLRRVPSEATACHLSGGVDSSLLTALAAEVFGPPLPAFVAAFSGYPEYNEAPYARAAADSVGATLVEVGVYPEDFSKFFSEVIRVIEEPKCHPPVFPRFVLEAEAAHRGVRTMISGRGADELFTGYDWHRPDQLADHRRRRTVVSPEERSRLLRVESLDALRYSPEEAYDVVFARCNGPTLLDRVLAMDWHTLMANWLILDFKISSYFNIQPYAPFVDRTMIDLALSIPAEKKAAGGEPKALLKRVSKSMYGTP